MPGAPSFFGTMERMVGSFPKFFDVDDTIVRVDLDSSTDEVFGTVVFTGKPYPPFKARVDGSPISPEDALALLKRVWGDKLSPEAVKRLGVSASAAA